MMSSRFVAAVALALALTSSLAAGGPALAQGEPQVRQTQQQTPPETAAAPAGAEAPVVPPPAPAIAPAAPVAPVMVVPAEINRALGEITQEVQQVEKSVDARREFEGDLARFRDRLDVLAAEATQAAEPLGPRLQAIRSQIEKLGPPPAKDAPPEAPALARERAALNAAAAEHDAALRRVDLLQVRIRQLAGYIQELRHQVFARDLMRRTMSPLRPAVWGEVGRELLVARDELSTILHSWWVRASPNLLELAAIVGLALVIFLMLRAVLGRLTSHWQARFHATEPTFFARAAVAAVQAPAHALPSLAALTFALMAMDERGHLALRMGWLSQSIYEALVVFIAVSAMTFAIFEPRLPRWRLFDLSDDSARRLSRLVLIAAAIYAVDGVAGGIIRNLYLSLPVAIVTSATATLAFASVLVAVVRTPFEASTPQVHGPVSRYWPRWLKLPMLLVALFVVLASLSGYVALGRFVAGQILISGTGLLLLFLLHLAVRAFAAQPIDPHGNLGQFLESRLGLDANRRGYVSSLAAFLLNLALVLVGTPLLLLTWGFSLSDIVGWLKSLIFGFEIGQFRISLARILLAVGLFLLLVFGTRLLQGWLKARVFPSTRLDAGVSNSVYTGVGYAGFALAALVAVSYAGFDISNVAIIAGALSVGIGFGLQSIVNNFVSGLILLVERPIKVGDWIVVKDREGIVRSISVRSTEIETFDRSSFIVPNSELVSGTVLNWTHRNSVGRVVIKVGVSYDADPEQVLAILLKVAQKNTAVLSHPPPLACFDNFGDHALEFSLRAFLGDIMGGLDAQTKLRTEILKEFRAAGIEIPYPQSDVHLRDLDGLKQALTRAIRARQGSETPLGS